MIYVSWIFMMKSIDIISKAQNHIDTEKEFRGRYDIKIFKKTLNNVQQILIIQISPWKEVEQRSKHPGILYSVKIST